MHFPYKQVLFGSGVGLAAPILLPGHPSISILACGMFGAAGGLFGTLIPFESRALSESNVSKYLKSIVGALVVLLIASLVH